MQITHNIQYLRNTDSHSLHYRGIFIPEQKNVSFMSLYTSFQFNWSSPDPNFGMTTAEMLFSCSWLLMFFRDC